MAIFECEVTDPTPQGQMAGSEHDIDAFWSGSLGEDHLCRTHGDVWTVGSLTLGRMVGFTRGDSEWICMEKEVQEWAGMEEALE